ncbi:MAG: class I SAM-dependent methyltransferase [Acidobacteria bacterium]|nr:class I SAM-dependent methyltransferase [Acidobacteriota bacterium]
MKKFAIVLVFIKLAFLACFSILAISSCQTASLSELETAPTNAATSTVTPNPTPNKTDDAINRPVSEPYTGDLSIFEDQNRAKNLQIERVMDILKIKEGKNVADIGAGSGWFTTLAAKRVGEKGKVFAVEINEEYITHIKNRAQKENFKNIETVLGAEDNPKLAKDSVDAVLILKTYHEIAEPIKVLRNIRASLRKDGLVGIIDKNGNGDDHGINKEKVIDELKRAGFVLKEEFDFTKADGMDYFLVFRATK